MSPISPVPFDVRGPSWLGLDLATFKLIERGYVLAGTQLLNEIAAVKLGPDSYSTTPTGGVHRYSR